MPGHPVRSDTHLNLLGTGRCDGALPRRGGIEDVPGPWRVHLPTVGQTCVKLALAPVGSADPWPLTLGMSALSRLGVRRCGGPRAVGSGHGQPLLASQGLDWHGVGLELETAVTGGVAEAALTAPSWDELEHLISEDDFWALVDVLAEAVTARYGVIGDGEALGRGEPITDAMLEEALRRHFCVLVRPVCHPPRGSVASRYGSLVQSNLEVLLR